MSDYINDIINRYAAEAAAAGSAARGTQKAGSTDDGYTSWRDEKKGSGAELSFTDMLGLMVAQFQNQTIDNQADTNDMMNQLIQMTMMQGMTKMTTQMEDLTQANILSYSASLVGKEVTVGVKDEEGNLQEIVGTVTAAGTYDGHPVIFIGDKSYLLSSIMAVGKLPEIKDPEKPGEGDGDGTDPDGDGNGTDPVDPPENNGGTESGGGAGDSGGTEGT
ncbi:MAG: flagellar hook capping protein [Lawsonibacter sp.]|nr:flagellar hook capping protein [Lawsonibacter sp.]